jgi:long-chain acyl-CoA synthetase
MKDTEKTIAQIFWERVEQKGDKPLFVYHKPGDFPPFTHKGKLRTMSWNQVAATVKNLGMGLLALGAKKGEPISIMSATRMEWALADLALLSIGGATGSIYPNNVPAQAQYILNDLNSRFLFVEEEWQRNAFLKRKATSPQLEKIITMGCEAGDDPLCMSFDDLIALGASQNGKAAAAFEQAIASGQLSDIASYIYTSGTTGIPKGAVHNHEALTYTIYTGAKWLPIEPGSMDLAFLPMAHIFEQFAGALLDIYRGDVTVAFSRGLDKAAKDFGFIKPTFIRVVPRLLEKVYSTVWSKSDVLAHLTHDGMEHALEISRRVRVAGALDGQAVAESDRLKVHEIEENNFEHLKKLVFGGNLQFMVTGGAPLSREINEFFWKLGIPVYELYGLTEAGGATTNMPGHARIGTVGQPWPNYDWPGRQCEFSLSPEGEILVRGPNVMLGYHNKPEDTAEALKDGWLHSGDVAKLDEDGFVTITDRMKDILITASGKNVAPIHIEGMFKEEPLISQAVVYGDRKKYLTAIITLDPDELKKRANELGLPGGYREWTAHPQVRAAVEEIVKAKNQDLASYETIKKFIVLDHDFSIQDGHLTPTVKVKRKEIYKRYGELMEALYTEN